MRPLKSCVDLQLAELSLCTEPDDDGQRQTFFPLCRKAIVTLLWCCCYGRQPVGWPGLITCSHLHHFVQSQSNCLFCFVHVVAENPDRKREELSWVLFWLHKNIFKNVWVETCRSIYNVQEVIIGKMLYFMSRWLYKWCVLPVKWWTVNISVNVFMGVVKSHRKVAHGS